MAREVYLISAHGENFKGMSNATIQFNDKLTIISGINAAGKTTVLDLVTWILTNKDSLGNEKFEIRTLDENGDKIHFLDIIGELVFRIIDDNGDRTLTLRKIQKEIWRKKRGSQEQEFAGNQNSFEVDGYPTNEAGFKVTIAENIGSEQDIRMLMNPSVFPGLDWKEQRRILTALVPHASDTEIAEEIGGYELILDELSKAPSTDEILKKYKNERKELQKRQIELPTRIDEVSMRKVDVDSEQIAIRKAELNAELADLQLQIENAEAEEKKAAEEQQAVANNIKAMKTKLAQMTEEVKADYLHDKRVLEFFVREKQSEIKQVEAQIKQEEAFLNHEVGEANYYSNQVETLKETYKAVKKSQWKGETSCPTCGQILPQSQVEKAKQNWQQHQLEELGKIAEDGKQAAAKRDDAKAKADERGITIAKLIDSRTELVSAKKALEEKLDALVEPGVDSEQYKSMEAVILKREEELKQMYFAPKADVDSLISKKNALQKELVNLGISEAQAAQNAEIDERIDSLKSEMKDISTKVLRCEQFTAMVEQFVTAKMNRISDKINAMFDGIQWRLWENQINGGIREICECSVDGVPYGDLNHGHQIIAGIKIIEALRTAKGVELAIFVDNAEALSSDNVPEIDGQLVLLTVTDDPALTVR